MATNQQTTWRDVGGSALGLLGGVLDSSKTFIGAVADNAKANASGNQAIADANRAMPGLITTQLTQQQADKEREQKIILYAGGGILFVVLLFTFILAIRKKSQ